MHELRHLAAARMLSGSTEDQDIRILRRVAALQDFPLAPRGDGPIRRVAIVDTECTGTDPQVDEIIDVAVVVLEVDEAGEIVGIASAGEALRDPGMPIPAAISRITGITDDDVVGKAIDLDRLGRRLASADVRIAHFARFDIAFLETLMPGLAGASWACSATDFDWIGAGADGCKLGHLLMQHGFYNEAHRAMADVISLIRLLSHRLPGGGTVLRDLLANAERPTVRVEATNAPFQHRSALKSRGYRWDPRARTWWIEVSQDEEATETQWLQREVIRHGPTPRTRAMTWHERHR